ncbi:ERF family protein [Streptococcus suis]|nr:ERF family protein [Streptococcus suis]NQL22073.1 ERF family protein [Streptococcus suis]NQL44405.1 ERF family protein [Streptococcus suis]NQM00155.1 ERF family protein [Streptococcus suis]
MMRKSETIIELSKAFAKMQMELEQPLKNADNPFFKSKYVPLENVVDSITRAANKHGLSFTQFPSSDENGNVTVGTMVMHESGEWIEYDPICMKPVKNDPQAVGSAITYAKRYALSAIFGITSDNDDDGNEATQPGKATPKATPKKQVSTTSNKIPKEVVKAYKDAIQFVIERTGKNDGSITRWFCEKLGVVNIEDITMEQISLADGLLKKLENKQ